MEACHPAWFGERQDSQPTQRREVVRSYRQPCGPAFEQP
jgi:hypothetical protein